MLKTLLVMASRVTPLQLLQPPKSPFWGNLTSISVFHASGIVSLSHISEYAHQRAWCFSFFSYEHFYCHYICSTCLPALHHLDGSFHLLHGRWIFADIQVLYCRWNLSYLFRNPGLFRMLSKCTFQRASFSKEHCHLCLLQGLRCFKAIIYVIKCFNRIGQENIWFSVDMHARKRLSRLFVSNERKNCYRRWRKVPLSPSLVALGASCFPVFKTALDLDHAVNEVFPDQNDVKQHVLIGLTRKTSQAFWTGLTESRSSV